MLKNNSGSNGFLILQETRSSLADEKKWANEIKFKVLDKKTD